MKDQSRQPGKPVEPTARSFTWAIRSSEIAFTDPGMWEAPMQGCDCGPLVITPQPRDKSPSTPDR